MSKKNSLTQFKKSTSPILPSEVPTASPQTPLAASSVERTKTGPKPKPAAQKRTHRVMLSMTPAEAAISKRNAGLAGEATMIMAFLKQNGYFDT